MSVIYFLIAISLLFAISFLIVFLISLQKGQFDDYETPAMRILFDDEDDKSMKK